MALSKKQSNQISDLINSLLVQQQFVEERKDSDLFVQHARWFNESADKLIELGINVNKYDLTFWQD